MIFKLNKASPNFLSFFSLYLSIHLLPFLCWCVCAWILPTIWYTHHWDSWEHSSIHCWEDMSALPPWTQRAQSTVHCLQVRYLHTHTHTQKRKAFIHISLLLDHCNRPLTPLISWFLSCFSEVKSLLYMCLARNPTAWAALEQLQLTLSPPPTWGHAQGGSTRQPSFHRRNSVTNNKSALKIYNSIHDVLYSAPFSLPCPFFAPDPVNFASHPAVIL